MKRTVDPSEITTDVRDRIATVTLNRPRLNILDLALLRAMDAAVESLEARNEWRVLILRGAPQAFSAGVAVEDHLPDRIEDTLRSVHRVLGPRRVVVARSLTKVWEEWLRGDALEVAERFRSEGDVKGELTLVVEGFRGPASAADAERTVELIVGCLNENPTLRDVYAASSGLWMRHFRAATRRMAAVAHL
ncbi:MAG: enoyl-CoA hydratase-related protein, partial [Candidatus Thermoplasmatota archaeon]